MHLSSVDFPEPFRPRIPTVSPSATSKADVAKRPEVLVGVAPGVEHPLLERLVLLVVEAEPSSTRPRRRRPDSCRCGDCRRTCLPLRPTNPKR